MHSSEYMSVPAALLLSVSVAELCRLDRRPWWFVGCWQAYKSALPSHTVYTLNMERILNRMTHPSHEELEQDEIHRQEMNLKRHLNDRERFICPETSSAM